MNPIRGRTGDGGRRAGIRAEAGGRRTGGMTDVGAAAPCVRAPFDHAQGGPSAAGDGQLSGARVPNAAGLGGLPCAVAPNSGCSGTSAVRSYPQLRLRRQLVGTIRMLSMAPANANIPSSHSIVMMRCGRVR
jgi:hypothetical protein